MSQYYKEIAEKIENGVYYKDGKEWYFKKYITPFLECNLFIILTVAALAISSMGIVVLYNFFPLKKKVPIVVSIKDGSEQFPKIINLARKGEKDSNEILIKWVLSKYIRSFESYDFENNFSTILSNSQFLKQFSSKDTFAKYRNYISTKNPQSLTLRYRKHTKRYIQILERSFVITPEKIKEENAVEKFRNLLETEGNEPPEKYTAEVDFDVFEISYTKSERYKLHAKIDFYFTGVKFNKEKNQFKDFSLVVTDYTTPEI